MKKRHNRARSHTDDRDPLERAIAGRAWWENLGGYEHSKAKAKNKKYSGEYRGGNRR